MTSNQRRFDNAVAGALGGMFAVTMSYPADYIKTRAQFSIALPVATGGGAGGAAAAKAPPPPSLSSVVRHIWVEGFERPMFGVRPLGGVLGFYRGLDQLLPEAAFKVLFRFLVFTEVQELYRTRVMRAPANSGRPLPFEGNIACGALAGFLEAAVVVQPFERGKTLRADFESPYAVWGRALRERGVGAALRSVYTGFVPCAGRQIGNQAVSFTVFYSLKNNYLARRPERSDLNTLERLSFGFIGGCGGALTTMPLDVAKTLAQKQQGAETTSTRAIFADIVRKRGVRGLYTGLAPRLARVGLDRAFLFLAVEWITERLKAWH